MKNAIVHTSVALSISASFGASAVLAASTLRDRPSQFFNPPSKSQPTRLSQILTDSPRQNGSSLLTADSVFFRPPDNQRPRSGSRTTTGTRSDRCVSDRDAQFAIFGPDFVVGQTTLARPTFTWYLPPSSRTVPITFRLLAPNEEGIPSTIYTLELPYIEGYNSYLLPAEAPALSSGLEYRWQVSVNCEPNSPSRSIALESSVERVDPSAALAQKLAAATTAEEKALAYGAEGLWYDAIAQVAQAPNNRAAAIRAGLLKDLTSSEANKLKPVPD